MAQSNKPNRENSRATNRMKNEKYYRSVRKRRRRNRRPEYLINIVERSNINRGLKIKLMNDIDDGIITDDIALYEKIDKFLEKQKNRVELLKHISSYRTEVDEEDPDFIDEIHNYLFDYLKKEILNYNITDLDSLKNIENKFFKLLSQICEEYDEEGIWEGPEETVEYIIEMLKEWK